MAGRGGPVTGLWSEAGRAGHVIHDNSGSGACSPVTARHVDRSCHVSLGTITISAFRFLDSWIFIIWQLFQIILYVRNEL